MKILMTGFTALQRGPKRQKGNISKIDVPAGIVAALRAGGHEVDWRPVTLGEDLDSYDAAWVNLARPISMNSRVGAFGAIWTLASGVPAVGFYDDWQSVLTVANDFDIMTRRPRFAQKIVVDPKDVREMAGSILGRKLQATHYDRESAAAVVEEIRAATGEEARTYRFYEEDYDKVERLLPQFREIVQAMSWTGERWAAGLVPVCPMYSWGDRSIVQRLLPESSGPLLALDPSEVIFESILPYELDPPRRAAKKREWLLAALMPADKFLADIERRATWPVHNTGSQTLIKRRGQGERLKTEADVLDRYAERWGALSPPYPHAGSGWWRSRFMYAAATGTVLTVDPADARHLGPAYEFTVEQVEAMPDRDLEFTWAAQADIQDRLRPEDGTLYRHAEQALLRAVKEDQWKARS